MDVAMLIWGMYFWYTTYFKREWPDPPTNVMEARSEVLFSCKMQWAATDCTP